MGSRSRPAQATTRRKGRDEQRAGLANVASKARLGPVWPFRRAHDPSLNRVRLLAFLWLLWPLAQLSVEQRLSFLRLRDSPFSPLVCLLTPIALVRPPAYLRWYRIPLYDERPRLLSTYRCPIAVAHLIRFVSAQYRQHPVEHVRRTRAHRLRMMLAFAHHLVIVDRGDLWIVAARYLGIQIGEFFDEIRSSLSDMQALGFILGILLAVRDQYLSTHETDASN